MHTEEERQARRARRQERFNRKRFWERHRARREGSSSTQPATTGLTYDELNAVEIAKRGVWAGEDRPLATVWGDIGHYNVYEDRVEMFLPALLAPFAGGLVKSLGSKVLGAASSLVGKAVQAGKSLLPGAVAAAGNVLQGALGLGAPTEESAEPEEELEEASEESEAEEESEEEDADEGVDYPYVYDAEEAFEEFGSERPPGVYVHEDRIELFLPGLIGAAAPLLGKLGGLFGKKKRRKPKPLAEKAQGSSSESEEGGGDDPTTRQMRRAIESTAEEVSDVKSALGKVRERVRALEG